MAISDRVEPGDKSLIWRNYVLTRGQLPTELAHSFQNVLNSLKILPTKDTEYAAMTEVLDLLKQLCANANRLVDDESIKNLASSLQ